MFDRDRKKKHHVMAHVTRNFPTFQPPLPWITRSSGRLTSVTSRSAQPQALRHVSSHSLRFRHVTILPEAVQREAKQGAQTCPRAPAATGRRGPTGGHKIRPSDRMQPVVRSRRIAPFRHVSSPHLLRNIKCNVMKGFVNL